MEKQYYTSNDICSMYGINPSTLWRWRKRKINPFPEPDTVFSQGNNRWKIVDVEEWAA